MVICDTRLYQGLLKNLTDLSSLELSPHAHAVIQSSRAMALELCRRSNVADARLHYAAGRRLIADAASASRDRCPATCQALMRILEELPEARTLPPHYAACETYSERIRRGVVLCFEGSEYPFVPDPHLKSVIEAMLAWERDGYVLKTPAVPDIPEDQRLVAVDAVLLQTYLRSHWRGYHDARVMAFTPIAGGFSKQTILFDVQRADGQESFVYRGVTKLQIMEPVLVDIAHEFHVVSYAFLQGVPVAEPLWLQPDSGATGTRFFISRRMPGINLGSAVKAHAPVCAVAAQSLGRALAAIHALPLDSTDAMLCKSHLRPPSGRLVLQDVIRRRIEEWRGYFRSLDAPSYPTLELAFQWLLENITACEDDVPVVVHGDYGLHNILVDDDRVAAVLDWEACHLGDRALDLSHILSGTAGSMDHGLFMDAYVAAGGRRVSPFRLKYYQVLMSMQFMLSTIDAQHIFERQAAAGTQYCTLGLGFIEHTASSVVSGIREAAAARKDM